MARYFAHLSRADDGFTRHGVEVLPAALDHVDTLIAEGTISRPGEPTAADFQIASTLGLLRTFADFEPLLAGRPGLELADRLFPDRGAPLPPFLPVEWLIAAGPAGSR